MENKRKGKQNHHDEHAKHDAPSTKTSKTNGTKPS